MSSGLNNKVYNFLLNHWCSDEIGQLFSKRVHKFKTLKKYYIYIIELFRIEWGEIIHSVSDASQ